MTDFQDGGRVSPLVDLVGGYTVAWFTAFAGVELVADLWGGSAHLDPFVGVEFDIRRVTIALSARWFHPAGEAFYSSFEYVTPGYQGAFGLLIGIKVRRDLDRRRDGDADG